MAHGWRQNPAAVLTSIIDSVNTAQARVRAGRKGGSEGDAVLSEGM